jgi:hypothetical protein
MQLELRLTFLLLVFWILFMDESKVRKRAEMKVYVESELKAKKKEELRTILGRMPGVELPAEAVTKDRLIELILQGQSVPHRNPSTPDRGAPAGLVSDSPARPAVIPHQRQAAKVETHKTESSWMQLVIKLLILGCVVFTCLVLLGSMLPPQTFSSSHNALDL